MPIVNGLREPMLRVLEEAIGEGRCHNLATLGKRKAYMPRHNIYSI